MPQTFEIEIRVRYNETDAQGHVHHSTYFNYFELGRTEWMRAIGRDYESLESEGFHLVVAEIACRYLLPCRFGDLIRLQVELVRAKGARLKHNYQLYRDDDLLAEGESTIASIDDQGQVRRLPQWLVELAEKNN